MERRIDLDLQGLREDLLRMAGEAENALGSAIKALALRDRRLAEQVIREDDAINLLEMQIDERCMTILARHQPEATDLRFVTMAMKINNDLERLGDEAVNIAERTLELLNEPALKPLLDIPRMAELAQRMLRDSLDAFVQGRADLARAVCRRDDEVDDLQDQIVRELATYMIQDPKYVARAISLMLVARHVERVADHATNIAEDVIYLLEGRTIKHGVAGA